MKYGLLICLLLIGYYAQAQSGGVVRLERNGHPIERFYPGTHITFLNLNDQLVDGTVTAVNADTIFLKFYDVRQVISGIGLPMLDTIHNMDLSYAFEDIKAIVKYRKFDWKATGIGLMVAGVGVLVLGVVNGAYMNQPSNEWISNANLWTFAALTGFGFWLAHQNEKHYKLGKKFRLVYYGYVPENKVAPKS
jgi:hypothetical protein